MIHTPHVKTHAKQGGETGSVMMTPPPCSPGIWHLSNSYHHPNKSSAQLMQEIAGLETQILHLEAYLLSLYRTAFPPTPLHHHAAFTNHDRFLHTRSLPPPVQSQPDATRCSLAHLLGTSHTVSALTHPAELSQHILTCMSCIYCKFATPHKALSTSSASSLSSSNTFSATSVSAPWSPQSSDEGLRDNISPYGPTVEVTRICLDDDSFKYAAKMLQKFRSLVESLEYVDPSKMKREEKLAFWLNIHNALVMHGYLAYGTHNSARNSSILKAAYNVGGHCINAHVIQSSILGIPSHYSAPWIQTLLSPKKKTTKHIYCLEYPEPLVHFALCSGSRSDPLVRVYTANTVFQDLKVARDEFIGATVHIHKGSRLYLPKVVCQFGREMSMSMNELLETVCSCVAEAQQKTMRACIKGREDKCVSWVPTSSSFRFMILKEEYMLNSYNLS